MVASQIPHMTYQQYRTARRLVHECCNLRELPAPGQRRGMYLPSKYHLFVSVPLVPCRRPSVGRWSVRCSVPAACWQTTAMPGVRKAVCPSQAQHALLFHLRRRPGQT